MANTKGTNSWWVLNTTTIMLILLIKVLILQARGLSICPLHNSISRMLTNSNSNIQVLVALTWTNIQMFSLHLKISIICPSIQMLHNHINHIISQCIHNQVNHKYIHKPNKYIKDPTQFLYILSHKDIIHNNPCLWWDLICIAILNTKIMWLMTFFKALEG